MATGKIVSLCNQFGDSPVNIRSANSRSSETVLTFPSMNSGVAKAIPSEWSDIIRGYLVAQSAAGRPRTTVATRRGHLARMARELHAPPAAVTADMLVDWFGSDTNTHWATETRRGYRNTIRGFFQWAYRDGRLTADLSEALEKVKASKPSPRPAPDTVWTSALLAADRRVTVMLRLAAEGGLRRGEVARVHTTDLTYSVQGAQLLVHGKGDKLRIIPINDGLAALIDLGAAGHTPGTSPNGWLFPGADDGHLSPRWVGKLCTKVMPGIWTMHKLRHRFAAKVYRGSRNLRALQVLLGHESVATTEIYTPVDDDEIRAAMQTAVA